MSDPDDPFASPPRDAEGRPPARPPYGAPTGQAPRPGPQPGAQPGPPPGPPPWPSAGPPPPGSGGVGVAALVVGLLALLLSVSIVGGLVLGSVAIALGTAGRRRAAATRGSAGLALAGLVLGVLGWVGAGATWLWVRGDLASYRACERASVSFADDRACRRQFERDLRSG